MSSVPKQDKGSRPIKNGCLGTVRGLCHASAKGHGCMKRSRQRSLYCVGGMVLVSVFGMFHHVQPMELPQELPSQTSISFRQIEAESLPDMKVVEPVPQPETHKLLADASDFTLQEPTKPMEPKPEPKPKPKPKPQPKPKPKPEPKPEPVAPVREVPELEAPEPQEIQPTQADAPTPTTTTATQNTQNTQNSQNVRSSAEQERVAHNNMFNALLKEIERHKSYPKAARRNKTEGTVYLVVELDPKGKVVQATVPPNASSPPILAKATQQLGDNLRGFVVQNPLGKALSLRIPIEYSLR